MRLIPNSLPPPEVGGHRRLVECVPVPTISPKTLTLTPCPILNPTAIQWAKCAERTLIYPILIDLQWSEQTEKVLILQKKNKEKYVRRNFKADEATAIFSVIWFTIVVCGQQRRPCEMWPRQS